MFDLTDTVCAVASPPDSYRSIIRITGPQTLALCTHILADPIERQSNGLLHSRISVTPELSVDGVVYVFFAPKSYTGQNLIELHVTAAPVLVRTLLDRLLTLGARQAGPGEFTARAYLNGKLDLAQAEAVNDIISGTNALQLAAAERLLSGRLSEKLTHSQAELLDLMSLLEAGMDFSEEDIEFITVEQAVERIETLSRDLNQLLIQSRRNETLTHLPSVGLAGVPNAGKSSLFNVLLHLERSIVSSQHKTTRDVLAERLSLPHGECVLFDCAGLLDTPDNVLDRLAQQAALTSLNNCQLVLFCLDSTKADWTEDLAIYQHLQDRPRLLIATKIDCLDQETLSSKLTELKDLFGNDCLAVSAHRGDHLDRLVDAVDQVLFSGTSQHTTETDLVLVSARHRQVLQEALTSLTEASEELIQNNHDIACMILRATYQSLSRVEQHVDEQVLDTIFSRFCIGK